MADVRDYDTAVNLIADADHLTKGLLLGHAYDDEGAGPSAGPSSGASYSDTQRHKIEQGWSRPLRSLPFFALPADAIHFSGQRS